MSASLAAALPRVLVAVTLLSQLAHALPGSDEVYQVYQDFYDQDGKWVPADIEFYFGVAAINTIRRQCNDSYNFPPIIDDDVEIYPEECRKRVGEEGSLITLSFDVPAPKTRCVSEATCWDSIYVILSTVTQVGDVAPANISNISDTPTIPCAFVRHEQNAPSSHCWRRGRGYARRFRGRVQACGGPMD